MTAPRVLLYGDNGPGSGGACYLVAFRRVGCPTATLFDWAGLERYQTSVPLRVWRRVTRQVREPDRRRHVAALFDLAAGFRPDVVVVTKGLHLSAADVGRLKAGGAWVANVNHDDFFSRYRLNWNWMQRRAVPAYDQILTTREVNVAEVRPLNPRVEFFPFAYDPAVHRPVPVPPGEAGRWEADVLFVGGWAPHRGWLVEELVRAVPARYAVYGPGWDRHVGRRSPVRPFVRSGGLWLDDLARATGAANVALGFLRKENRDDYTQRTFEIPASNGVLLAERTDRHRRFYEEGTEAEFFAPDSPAELAAKVRLLLADPAHRERVRRAGYEAVRRQKHTYDDRVGRVLELYRRARPAA